MKPIRGLSPRGQGNDLEQAAELERVEWVVVALIALVILVFMAHLRWTWFSDDAYYRDWAATDGQANGSLAVFLQHRLSNWTSRVAIEAAIFTIVNHIIGWRIITAFAFWLVVVLPVFLVARDTGTRIILFPISGLLVLSIPGTVWFDAGLIATSVNYLWALAAGLLAAAPAVLFLQKRRCHPILLIASVLAVLFAGSAEIISVFLTCLYVASLGVFVFRIRNSKPSDFGKGLVGYWAVILIGFALFLSGMVFFHVTSTGNAARGMPSWRGPTVWVTVEAAYSSTLRQIFMSGYLIPLAFFLVLTVLCFKRYGFSAMVLIPTAPVIGSLLLRDAYVTGLAATVFRNSFNDGNLFWDTNDPALPQTLFPDNLLTFTVLTLLLLSAIVAILVTIRGPVAWRVLVVLAAGFVSKFIVVPTIGHALTITFHRTDLLLLFSFLIATLIALRHLNISRLHPQQSSGLSVCPAQ